MKGRRPRAAEIFSPAILERQLRRVLMKGKSGRRVVVGCKSYRSNAAYCEIKDPWDKGHHIIRIEPMWTGLVHGLIHELLHLHLRARLKPWGSFEEDFVEEMERQVCGYISKRPRHTEWWEGAVRLKMDEPKVPVEG
jgi:hypothetical protein